MKKSYKLGDKVNRDDLQNQQKKMKKGVDPSRDMFLNDGYEVDENHAEQKKSNKPKHMQQPAKPMDDDHEECDEEHDNITGNGNTMISSSASATTTANDKRLLMIMMKTMTKIKPRFFFLCPIKFFFFP